MYLLDTDILTLIERDHPRVVERLGQVDPDTVTTTVITKIEILQGRFESVLKAGSADELLRAQERLVQSESLLGGLEIVPIDASVATQFERFRRDKKLKRIGRTDLLIACIAVAHRATLVTRNLKDFQLVPGLSVENWAD